MIKDNFLTVKDISKYHNVTPRHVRQIIKKLTKEQDKGNIGKDHNGDYKVNFILLPHFKRVRQRKESMHAFTLDPSLKLTEDEIHTIMRWIFTEMRTPDLEINYVIEQKRFNGRNHVHGYINSKQKARFIRTALVGFSALQYDAVPAYDLLGWKNYMQKDNNNIVKLNIDICKTAAA